MKYLSTFSILCLLFSYSVVVKAQHRHCGNEIVTEHLKNQHPEQAHHFDHFHRHIIPALERQGSLPQRNTNTTLTIPVVVHVIHNGEPTGTGANLSAAQIQAQIDILNQDFSAQNTNFAQTPAQWVGATGNPNIQFCLASIDPAGNPTTGITRHNMAVTGTDINNSNIEDGIKPATYWNSNNYYNIWTLSIPGTTANGGTVGYAYLPNQFTVGASYDGTVVDWNWFGGPGFGQTGYKTLTHETGHYLGLPHTFSGDSCDGDDNISDTPNIGNATSSLSPGLSCSNNNFPAGPSSCGNEHMYVNYMDYVNADYCYTSFTNGQIAVMRGVLEGNNAAGFAYGSRAALVNNSHLACAAVQNDIGMASIVRPTDGNTCEDGSVVPEIVVGNFGTDAVNSFTVTYQVNGGTPVATAFTQTIASGGTITVVLPAFIPPAEHYTFTATTSNPNGAADENPGNDTQSVEAAFTVATALPLMEGFNSNAFDPTENGLFNFNPDEDGFEWQRASVSAFGNSGGAALFNNYEGSSASNPGGTIDALITPVYNFSTATNPILTFDVAYARYFGNGNFFSDSLRILVSTDCGSNFNQLIFNEGGATLETGTATDSEFVPTSNEWATKTVDLSAFAGQENVTVAFVNKSGWGNMLYLDNINIDSETACNLNFSISKMDESQAAANDGSATVNVNSGAAPFTYQWSNGMTTASVNNLAPGSYTVTVTDNEECEGQGAVSILAGPVNCEMTLALSGNDLACFGAADGSIQSTISGGQQPFVFNWNNGMNTSGITGLTAGTYQLVVTDALGCSALATKTLAEPTALIGELSAVNAQPATTPTNGTATVVASGGTAPYFYQWNNGGTTATISASAGNYVVLITDTNGCTWSGEIAIDTDPVDCSSLTTSYTATNAGCFGANQGGISLELAGGYPEYVTEWSNGATTTTLSELPAGTYGVTITDALGCSAVHEHIVVSEEPELTVSLTPQSDLCQSVGGMITANAQGGTGNYDYLWSNGMTGSEIAVTQSGGYQVTVTDELGCVAGAMTDIEVSSSIMALTVETESATCTGGQDGFASAIVSGGADNYTYQWSNGATTELIEGLTAGNYAVTITDAAGCTINQVFSINEPPIITLTCEAIPTDQFIQASATGGAGGFTYQWNNGETGSLLQQVTAGTYIVTVTDQNGCTETCTTTLTVTASNDIETLTELTIFPNPVDKRLFVHAKFETNELGTIKLFNIVGQQVMEQPFADQILNTQLDIQQLPKGTYLLKIETGKGSVTRKIVVM